MEQANFCQALLGFEFQARVITGLFHPKITNIADRFSQKIGPDWAQANFLFCEKPGSICRDISVILKFNLALVFLRKILRSISNKNSEYQARCLILKAHLHF